LQATNQQLCQEIQRRKRVESRLRRLAAAISRRNLDLEIILDTLRDHGDAIHDQWQAKVEETKRLAEVDSLTQIANRRRFDAHLLAQWRQMAQQLLRNSWRCRFFQAVQRHLWASLGRPMPATGGGGPRQHPETR
jgi:PleD family two-component response regulator